MMKEKMAIRYMMLLCVVSVIFLSGCGGFIYDFDTPYEEESKERIDGIAAAIEAGDVEAIYKLLSPYAQEEIEEPKEKIMELLDFFEGEIVSAERDVNGTADGWNHSEEKEWGENYGTLIYVKTNKKKYSVTVIDSNRNSDEKRVGINVIKVIEEDKKDNTDEWKIGSENYPLPCITCLYE